jgi:hypothetical protein
MTGSVPATVRGLVDIWRAAGCPTQPAMPWNRERWNAWNPRHHSTLAALPDALDRPTVRRLCEHATTSPEAAERAFVATMVWGYGEVGYGAFRVNRILSVNRAPGARLHTTAKALSERGAVAGYAELADYQASRLRFLGPAFGTKFLAFCSRDAEHNALILDRLVANWLQRNTTLDLDPVPWNLSTYARFVDQLQEWSAALDISPDDLECRIFSAESDATGNQWSGKQPH